MPPLYVTHQPAPLMHELRALRQKAYELRQRTQQVGITQQLAAPLPPVTVVGDGYMRSFWAQIDIEHPNVPIVGIADGYTIFNAWLFLISRPAQGPSTFQGRLWAEGGVVDYHGSGQEVVDNDPVFGIWDYLHSDVRKSATELVVLSSHWMRKPVYPSGMSALKLTVESEWEPDRVPCYHALLFGVYMVHGKAFFPSECT